MRRDGAAALAAAARRGRAARLQARPRARADGPRRAPGRRRGRGARRARAWSSPPATRARRCARCETAELACRALEHRAGRRGVARPTASTATTRSRCCDAHGDDARVLVVGHEPTFSQVVYDFTGGRVDFKKGGVAAVREARGAGELLVLLRPRELEALAADATPSASAPAITASATSARGCSEASSTNSSGLCALPPRGPRPSTVTGIVAAKWLASLAPPRARGHDRAPERRARAREQPARSPSSECMPGQRRISSASSRTPVVLGRDRVEHRLDRVELVGAQVAEELAAAGHDVERVAGAQDGRHGGQVRRAVGVVARRRRPARPRPSASSALRPRSGRGAGVRASGRARSTWIVPGRLAAHDDAVVAVRRALAALEAQARRPSRRSARRGAKSARAPLLVADEQQRELARSARGRWASARIAPSASTTPPFMSTLPEPTSCSPSRVERPVLGVRDDGVEVAEQQDRLRAGAASGGRRRSWRVAGARARDALDLRLVGQQRGAHRRALLGAVHVARRARRPPPAPRARAARGARSPPPPASIHGSMRAAG